MDTILLAFIFTAFNVLTVLCVVAIVVVTLINYGKPKGDKNGNRSDTKRTKTNPWRFW
jgi:hypothetical protein